MGSEWIDVMGWGRCVKCDGWKQDISYMGNMVEGNGDELGSEKAKLASRQHQEMRVLMIS